MFGQPATTPVAPSVAGRRLPEPGRLEYWRLALTVVLLAVSVPIVVYVALRRPDALAAQLVHKP